MKKRILCISISLLFPLILSCGLISCQGSAADVYNSETDPQIQSETSASIYDDLPAGNFNGYEFRVMTGYSNYAITNFDFESLNGEIINDTIYERNRTVEEKLNVRFTETIGQNYDSVDQMLRQTAGSGDDAFDLMFGEGVISRALDGYMVDLKTVSGIDLSNPWWDKGSIENYSIKGRQYFAYSNIHLHYYESLYTILFNKSLITDYALENPYELVKSGKWTLDKYFSVCSEIARDLNGDGTMHGLQDLYGSIYVGNQPVYLTIAAGGKYTVSDSAAPGGLVFSGADEKLAGISDKLSAALTSKDVMMTSGTNGVPTEADVYKAFESHNALFMIEVLGEIKDLRNMQTNFGILPLPKYDESQKEYISTNYVGASVAFIPATNTHLDVAGTVIENLGALSYEKLIPAYYEININSKQTRDTESIEMLNIMLGNIQYDIGILFNFGDMVNTYNTAILKGYGIAAEFEKIASKVNSSIQKTFGDE